MKINIILAQLNLTVGDIEGNTEKIINSISDAELKHNADIIIFPELSISSYPPEDLLLRPAFNDYINIALDRIVKKTRNIHALPWLPNEA
jgi:Predicted amidohydrolase